MIMPSIVELQSYRILISIIGVLYYLLYLNAYFRSLSICYIQFDVGLSIPTYLVLLPRYIYTLIRWAHILKIISSHALSFRAHLAGQTANGWPKQLWEKNSGGRQFSKLWWEGSMYLYVVWLLLILELMSIMKF